MVQVDKNTAGVMGEVSPRGREAHGFDLEADGRVRLIDTPTLGRMGRRSWQEECGGRRRNEDETLRPEPGGYAKPRTVVAAAAPHWVTRPSVAGPHPTPPPAGPDALIATIVRERRAGEEEEAMVEVPERETI